MSLRLKYGLTEVTRMSVQLDPTVSSVVKSALVEGDWVKLSSVAASPGMPASAKGIDLFAVPVTDNSTAGSKLSYPIIVNPQSPEMSVPGVGVTVACEKGFIGYTDRFDTGQPASNYANVPLAAHSFVISGTTRYGLIPAATIGGVNEVTQGLVVAWGIAIVNGELMFRYLP
jgi:hypothetical protein